MKILISSKQLAVDLGKIDFEAETVMHIRGKGGNLMMNTDKQAVEISCEIIQCGPGVKQENRRWDWIKNLVSKIEEQPVVLDIQENIVNVIFQY